jgi:hypothetical protein
VRSSRRGFLADLGFGCAGLALGSLLWQDGIARANSPEEWSPPTGQPHFAPKAKNVIWIFLSGGVSHMETFDPKPALTKYEGKTYDETGLPNPQKLPMYLERSRSVVGFDRQIFNKIFPLQVGFKKHGQSGIEVSDWLPHLASCVDDLCLVRSMYTTDNDHAAEFQMHTGRHALDEKQPVIGSWIHYGLGSLNENLPQFVFLGEFKDNRVKMDFDANYLGPKHNGIQLSLDPAAPLPFAARDKSILAEEQKNEFDYINRLNRLPRPSIPTTRSSAASRLTSWPTGCRCRPRSARFVERIGRDARPLRHRQQDDRGLRPPALGGPAAGRARRPLHALLSVGLRRVGLPPEAQGEPLAVVRAGRQADCRADPGPQAPRDVQ